DAVTFGYVGPAGLISGVNFTPAKPGEYLIIYGISFGATNPAFDPGVPPTGIGATSTPVTVTLGGNTLPAANILYAGVSPGTAGLYQLNIQVPTGLADGDYPLVLTVAGASTPGGGYITIKN